MLASINLEAPLSAEILEAVGAYKRTKHGFLGKDWFLKVQVYESIATYYLIRLHDQGTVQIWATRLRDVAIELIDVEVGVWHGTMTNQEFLNFYAGVNKS